MSSYIDADLEEVEFYLISVLSDFSSFFATFDAFVLWLYDSYRAENLTRERSAVVLNCVNFSEETKHKKGCIYDVKVTTL